MTNFHYMDMLKSANLLIQKCFTMNIYIYIDYLLYLYVLSQSLE